MHTSSNIVYVVGGSEEAVRPFPPFDDLQIEFLNSVSLHLRADPRAKQYPDVITFAFWCRRGNIIRIRDEFLDGRSRLGLGAVFHVAPSNVPINFAFSYVFGLLAGNSNYVRLPSRGFPQIDIICNALNSVLKITEFKPIKSLTHFFRYEHQKEITAEISAKCQGRVIWGGDETIQEIRKSPIHIRGVEIAFADRYSFCCLGASQLLALSESDFDRLVFGFYNDTYLMDQNACSSPHLIVWVGKFNDVVNSQRKFWNRLELIIQQRYRISAKAVVEKQLLFCKNAIELQDIRKVHIHNTSLFRVELGLLPERVDTMRGNCGYFYEFQAEDLDDIFSIVNSSYQTLTYAGLDKSLLLNLILSKRLIGIDRVVPVGSALDIGVVWDGRHMINSLSRIIEAR